MINFKELNKRVSYLFFGEKSCKSCIRRNESFVQLKSKYLYNIKALEESNELLNLAISAIDLNKVKHKTIKFKYQNRKYS